MGGGTGRVLWKDLEREVTSHLRLARHMSQGSVPSRGNSRHLEVGSNVSCCGNSKASVARPMNEGGGAWWDWGYGDQITKGFETVFQASATLGLSCGCKWNIFWRKSRSPRSSVNRWAVVGLAHLSCRGRVSQCTPPPTPTSSHISYLITPVRLAWAIYSTPEENSHLINFRFKATRSPYIKNGVGGRTAC